MLLRHTLVSASITAFGMSSVSDSSPSDIFVSTPEDSVQQRRALLQAIDNNIMIRSHLLGGDTEESDTLQPDNVLAKIF